MRHGEYVRWGGVGVRGHAVGARPQLVAMSATRRPSTVQSSAEEVAPTSACPCSPLAVLSRSFDAARCNVLAVAVLSFVRHVWNRAVLVTLIGFRTSDRWEYAGKLVHRDVVRPYRWPETTSTNGILKSQGVRHWRRTVVTHATDVVGPHVVRSNFVRSSSCTSKNCNLWGASRCPH